MRAQLSFVLSITRLTNGQTDGILIARPRLHSMQRCKNSCTEKHNYVSLAARFLFYRPTLSPQLILSFYSTEYPAAFG